MQGVRQNAQMEIGTQSKGKEAVTLSGSKTYKLREPKLPYGVTKLRNKRSNELLMKLIYNVCSSKLRTALTPSRAVLGFTKSSCPIPACAVRHTKTTPLKHNTERGYSSQLGTVRISRCAFLARDAPKWSAALWQ
eukprot:5446575-Amphidinium_carterae.1